MLLEIPEYLRPSKGKQLLKKLLLFLCLWQLRLSKSLLVVARDLAALLLFLCFPLHCVCLMDVREGNNSILEVQFVLISFIVWIGAFFC